MGRAGSCILKILKTFQSAAIDNLSLAPPTLFRRLYKRLYFRGACKRLNRVGGARLR